MYVSYLVQDHNPGETAAQRIGSTAPLSKVLLRASSNPQVRNWMDAHRFPLLRDRAWMTEQVGAGRSNADVAAALGCSVSSVVFAVSRLGLSGRRGHAETGWS